MYPASDAVEVPVEIDRVVQRQPWIPRPPASTCQSIYTGRIESCVAEQTVRRLRCISFRIVLKLAHFRILGVCTEHHLFQPCIQEIEQVAVSRRAHRRICRLRITRDEAASRSKVVAHFLPGGVQRSIFGFRTRGGVHLCSFLFCDGRSHHGADNAATATTTTRSIYSSKVTAGEPIPRERRFTCIAIAESAMVNIIWTRSAARSGDRCAKESTSL